VASPFEKGEPYMAQGGGFKKYKPNMVKIPPNLPLKKGGTFIIKFIYCANMLFKLPPLSKGD